MRALLILAPILAVFAVTVASQSNGKSKYLVEYEAKRQLATRQVADKLAEVSKYKDAHGRFVIPDDAQLLHRGNTGHGQFDFYRLSEVDPWGTRLMLIYTEIDGKARIIVSSDGGDGKPDEYDDIKAEKTSQISKE